MLHRWKTGLIRLQKLSWSQHLLLQQVAFLLEGQTLIKNLFESLCSAATLV